MITIPVFLDQRIASPWPTDKVFAYLQNYPVAIASHFPGLEKLAADSRGIYQWEFQSVEMRGYQIKIAARTSFKVLPPHLIQMESHALATESELSGHWKLEPHGLNCSVHFAAQFNVKLPLSILLKPVASPITNKEIKRLVESYAQRLQKALGG